MSLKGKLRSTGEQVVIIGPVLGMFRSESAGKDGLLNVTIEEGKEEWLYVGDKWGEIRKVKPCDIKLTKVDGESISDALKN